MADELIIAIEWRFLHLMAVLRSYKDFEMSVSQVIQEEVIAENPEVTSSQVEPAEPEARRLVPINLKK